MSFQMLPLTPLSSHTIVYAIYGVGDIVGSFTSSLDLLIKILMALALCATFYGGITLIRNADNEDGRAKGIRMLIWGVIGLFVMVSLWGVIAILQDDFLGGGGSVRVISGPS